jgi:hypothetical protein
VFSRLITGQEPTNQNFSQITGLIVEKF